jgi:DNA-binding transcriptional ArsR family regulator
MRAVKTISDPEAFKIAADETRRKMLFLMRAKEMTVSQIAQELNLTPQTVYFHIKKLVEADMVEVSREVRIDHLIESYYQATAEVFHFTVGRTTNSKETLMETIESVLNALKRIGFKVEYDKKTVNQLAGLQMKLQDCCGAKEYEEEIEKLEDVDFFVKQDLQEYISILSMSDEEMKKEDQIKKEFRKLLRSLIKKQ